MLLVFLLPRSPRKKRMRRSKHRSLSFSLPPRSRLHLPRLLCEGQDRFRISALECRGSKRGSERDRKGDDQKEHAKTLGEVMMLSKHTHPNSLYLSSPHLSVVALSLPATSPERSSTKVPVPSVRGMNLAGLPRSAGGGKTTRLDLDAAADGAAAAIGDDGDDEEAGVFRVI